VIERINLLPPHRRPRPAAGSEIAWFLLGLGMVAALLAFAWGREVIRHAALEKRRNEIVLDRDRLLVQQQTAAAASGRLQSLAAEQRALQVRLDALDALQSGRRSWFELLLRISRVTPEGLWLTAVESVAPAGEEASSLALRFQGKALSHERISELLGTLERDPDFLAVELISTAKGAYLDREVVDFTLSSQVRPR
jgi:Tfp pilus assembly protein PilN